MTFSETRDVVKGSRRRASLLEQDVGVDVERQGLLRVAELGGEVRHWNALPDLQRRVAVP
jgi:hypothetical protein